MCKELMLVIEVDGLTHTFEEIAAKDKQRQKEIEKVGFEVIRFDDDEILNHLNRVKEKLEFWIKTRIKSTPLIPRQRGS